MPHQPAHYVVPQFVVAVALLAGGPPSVFSADTDRNAQFLAEVKPILESACLSCHNPARAEGELRLDTRQHALTGGDSGPAFEPGKPADSRLYAMTVLPAGHDEVMPPDGPPLSAAQTDRLKSWIADGAAWPDDVALKTRPRINFARHVQPILETQCVACHSTKNSEGELDLTTRGSAFTSGDNSPAIVPFAPLESPLYTSTARDKDDDALMPPADEGGPLANDVTEILLLWIAQGAEWPETISLKQRAKLVFGPPSPDNMQLLEKIHALIVKQAGEESPNLLKDYSGNIPRTKAPYHMVAVKGGSFLMGSPASEPNRTAAEGPQVEVSIAPFWMGQYEVTWDEYEPFMITQVDRAKHGGRKNFDPNIHTLVDAVSQPTAPYTEMSFGMGQRGYPAISMTQHAANKYCQWLSAQTGHFYRLPTEAEWEYACRAGTKTAYSFGDDPKQLGRYAWSYDNSNEKYQKVGTRQPNPWGLHDMHGNVMEWTADQFVPDYFARIKSSRKNPLVKPTSLYPRSVRGGGWDDDPEQLRAAYRRGSEANWKQQDPQLPKSVWYHTNAPWLGFRIVRPKQIPTIEEMDFYWNSATGSR